MRRFIPWVCQLMQKWLFGLYDNCAQSLWILKFGAGWKGNLFSLFLPFHLKPNTYFDNFPTLFNRISGSGLLTLYWLLRWVMYMELGYYHFYFCNMEERKLLHTKSGTTTFVKKLLWCHMINDCFQLHLAFHSSRDSHSPTSA